MKIGHRPKPTPGNSGKLSISEHTGPAYTMRRPSDSTGFYYSVKPLATHRRSAATERSNLDATESSKSLQSHMLLSFQRPPCSLGGVSASGTTFRHEKGLSRRPAALPRLADENYGRAISKLDWFIPGPGSIALRRQNGRAGCSAGRQPAKAPLAELEHGAVQALGRHVQLVGAQRIAVQRAPRPGRAAAGPPSPRRRTPRAAARARARGRRWRRTRTPRSRPAPRAPRAGGRSGPRPRARPRRRGSGRPAPGPCARLDSTAGRPGSKRLVQQQVVVDGHRRVGDPHQLAEDLVGRLGDAHVVAQRLGHLLHPVGAGQDGHGQDRLGLAGRSPAGCRAPAAG